MSDVFDTSRTFSQLGLREDLLKSVTEAGFVHPTHIQSQLIPIAVTGRDVLGQAKTGSGKTAAFGLPILQQVQTTDSISVLILVPTRELAVQVAKELHDLGRHSGIHAVPIYGGQKMKAQITKLKKNPPIVVGTPGRVMDLHGRGMLPYSNVRHAVLDEVDRMLDIGFREDIRKILGSLKSRAQMIFVSATISPEIEKLARTYMRDPEKIVTSAKSLTVTQVKQSYISVQPWDKKRLLLHVLQHESPALTVVFCRMKRTVDEVAAYLQKNGIDAHTMHGDMFQNKRNSVMDRLRDGNLKVLVASDLAARGLDVEDISHVINYDVPEDTEVYIHRIGRTARAGRDGIAWSFVTPDQGELLTKVEVLANIEIPRLDYPGFVAGDPPAEVKSRIEAEERRKRQYAEKVSRLATPPPTSAEVTDTVDQTKFPGGLVPIAPPARRMGGRVKTGRR